MIRSVVWSSMIDYPDNICTTLFSGGCNFNCEFCYNQGLTHEKELNFDKEILPKLLERKEFINHILISGGECTIHPDFDKIVDKLYVNDFKIGIHTNGYMPEVLERNMYKFNFIGMDIKNDFSNYNEITKTSVDVEKIKKSINLILNSNVNYEFRTTVYPKYISLENVENIAKFLRDVGSKFYVLQNYFDYDKKVKPYSVEELKQMQEVCSKYLPTKIRGIM